MNDKRPNNGLHPTRDTLPVIKLNRVGGRVMPSVGRLPCRGDEHWDERSDAMNNLEHLFLVGEFPERAHLLSGLSLELVTLRPDGASYSIYEELWLPAEYHRAGRPSGRLLPERRAGARAPMARPGASVPGRRSRRGSVGADA